MLKKLPFEQDVETKRVLKLAVTARAALAQLNGLAISMPNNAILLETLPLQEAKDSSEIENIVTTHDELFRDDRDDPTSPRQKEVCQYESALRLGFNLLTEQKAISNKHILAIQAELIGNDAGFRTIPGTNLQDGKGNVVYEPPQDPRAVIELMTNFESVLNENKKRSWIDMDPLVRMAILHHQFESIHPFTDGNGRTGRILNALYLVKERLISIPILYLSRYIVKNKSQYYRLLNEVRDNDAWEEWICYMLKGVEETARQTGNTILYIKLAMIECETTMRAAGIYSQELLNHIFRHPYTKIVYTEEELSISRITATKYLNALIEAKLLLKIKSGRQNYYVNKRLTDILSHID